VTRRTHRVPRTVHVSSRHRLRYTSAVTRTPISAALVLSLALAPACNEDAPATPAAAGPAAPATPSPKTDPAAPTEAAGTPATPTAPTTPPLAAAKPQVPPAALDPLLDLIGAGADTYIVVRAPHEFIDGFGGIVLGGKDIWTRILDGARDPSEPDDMADLRKLLTEFDTIQTTLAAGGLHLERGFVVSGKRNGKSVTVLAADDPEALPKLARTMSSKPDEVTTTCKALPEVAGFVACSEDAAVLAAYQPGKTATTWRAAIASKLGDGALEGANVLSTFAEGAGDVVVGIHTTGGVLQIDVNAPGALPFVEVDAPGPATALALVSPGSSFAWGRLDSAALVGKAKAAPAMVTNIVRALSGEILVASIGTAPGIVTLIGLDDPTPVAGLIPMAALAKGSLPKQLPDGSKVEVVIESVDDGSGGTLQVLRAKVEPAGDLATLREQLGMQSEVTAFVTKQWAAVAMGTGTAVIPDVVKATGGAPSDALYAALPGGLADDLRAGRASMVIHAELDGLHAPGVKDTLATSIAGVPATAGKIAPKDALDAAFLTAAPLSSLSLWATSTADGAVFHFVARGFGDAITEEGRAAQQARFDVQTGARDAATAYGALVTAYPSSPRVEAYRVRAGQRTGSAAPGAAAIAGALAAIALPAFAKYIERSKAAGGAIAEVE